MRTVIKIIITTVLLSALLAPIGNAEARLKYYRYNDNIPMVEMSLNMMVAMGVLEPIPSRLVYDGNPYNRLATARYDRYPDSYYYPRRARYSGRSRYFDDYRDEPIRPYRRYSRSRYNDLHDFYDLYEPWERYRGSYWDSPRYSRWDSPWADRWGSPWSSAWDNPWDSPWGSRWGGSPWDSVGYSPWSSPWYSGGLNPWSTTLLNPWSSPYSYMGGWPLIQGYTTVPVLPEAAPGANYPGTNYLETPSYQPEPQSRQQPQPRQQQYRNGYKAQKTAWSARTARSAYRSRPHRVKYRPDQGRGDVKNTYQRLNGLWIDDSGEMLGIRGDRFLWNDDDRYARGQLLKSPTMMEARINETRTVIRFQYKLSGNELVILSRDGRTRTFHRMPLVESQLITNRQPVDYSSADPDSKYLHLDYSYKPAAVRTISAPPRAHGNPENSRAAKRVASRFASYAPASQPPLAVRALPVTYSRGMTPADTVSAPVPATTDSVHAPRPAPVSKTGERAAAADEPPVQESAPDADGEQPKTASGRNDEAEQEADGDDAAASLPADAAANDPYTYLYSYLKDPALASDRDAEGADDAGAAGAGANRGGSNIWKPNELFPQRRRDAINARPQRAPVSGKEEFAWSASPSWK